jgi:diacylglycerol O-acyltransferase-1
MEIALQYPKNLRFGHYVRFLIAPTCCYQLSYPMTARISKIFVLKRLIEMILGNMFVSYLVYQHCTPVCEEARIPIRDKDYLKVFQLTLKMAVPAAYCWLTMFYCVFHSYLNLFAELTRFGDRRFYSDWWNANNLGEYWRKWNQPIHNFLIRHVYYPCRRRGISSSTCMLITFTLSACFHEYIMAGILSVINFVAFILMMANVPAMLLQKQLKNTVSGNTNNLLFWLFYIIIGQPLGILFSYYQITEKNQ